MNIIGIFNILCIVVRQVDFTDTTDFIHYWILVQQIINLFFLIELISDFVIYGFLKSYQTNFRMTPETMCQCINLIAFFYFIQKNSTKNYNMIVKLLELVIFLRMLKLLTLLYEIKTMRIIIETMRHLIKPLLNLGGVLFSIYYVFALVGMALFGGRVQKNLDVIS